jgi:hypothetical protein
MPNEKNRRKRAKNLGPIIAEIKKNSLIDFASGIRSISQT